MNGACGGKHEAPKGDDVDVGSGTGAVPARDATASGHVTLPPAPPLPEVPAGLPARPEDAAITPERVALGELLFYEPRLSASGKTSCATCHVPALGFGGAQGLAHQSTDDDKPNLRRAMPLVNLAWKPAFAWDGRYATLADQLGPHVKGQLGSDLAAAVKALADNPVYQAHVDRANIHGEADLVAAIAAFVATRYAGGAPWDRVERTPDAAPADLKAGYQLFTHKAGCATCHVPPLYTDHGFHALGLVALPDEGRGKVDPAAKGAFATPTLRGAALRGGFFHDGSAKTLDAAIDWHLAGGTGQGADASIVDKALAKVALTADERRQLGAFVAALTDAAAPAPVAPKLPQ